MDHMAKEGYHLQRFNDGEPRYTQTLRPNSGRQFGQLIERRAVIIPNDEIFQTPPFS